MTQARYAGDSTAPHTFGEGYLFGVPVGGLGWFASLVVSVAVGFVGFFSATFLAIFGILFYNMAARHALDFTVAYRWIGLPVGLAVLLFALIYMGRLWVRGQIHRA